MEKKIKPTEAELEIMQILWSDGPSSVRHVHQLLSETKEVFYTTTLKTMQIMLEKGLLSRDTSERAHIYKPEIGKNAIEKTMIDKMVNSMFSGSTSKMIISAMGNQQPSPEELKEIRQLIDQLSKKQSK